MLLNSRLLIFEKPKFCESQARNTRGGYLSFDLPLLKHRESGGDTEYTNFDSVHLVVTAEILRVAYDPNPIHYLALSLEIFASLLWRSFSAFCFLRQFFVISSYVILKKEGSFHCRITWYQESVR